MDTKHLSIEFVFVGKHAPAPGGSVTIVSQKPTTGGKMVVLSRALDDAPETLKLDVYHDIVGNGFTSWPDAKTLNSETLVMILAAFDNWIANCPAKALDMALVRMLVNNRDHYKDALAVLTMHG